LVRAPQRVNTNLFFKCKNTWVGLKVRNVFVPSSSLNKVFSTATSWIAHSRAVLNTPATNFFPFNFFPFKIFSIFFSSLNFFFFSLIDFFPYCKEKINWCDFFYIVQKLGDNNFFPLRLGWIFLFKHVCFCL